MDMARIDYSLKVNGDTFAKVKANELSISPKHAIEIASLIRGMKTSDAKAYLEDVVALEKAVPFRRFRRNVAHKRGIKGDAGRYPVKAAGAYLRLIDSLEKNAEYIGLDSESLKIIHSSVNRGRCMRGIFPRAMGRATEKKRETTNIEIIAREV